VTQTIPSRLLHARRSLCRLATVGCLSSQLYATPASDWAVIHVVRVHVMWPITRPVPRDASFCVSVDPPPLLITRAPPPPPPSSSYSKHRHTVTPNTPLSRLNNQPSHHPLHPLSIAVIPVEWWPVALDLHSFCVTRNSATSLLDRHVTRLPSHGGICISILTRHLPSAASAGP